MSNNPYADESASITQPGVPRRTRPGGVTLVGVLALVLGCLGLLGSCGGVVGLTLTPMMQGVMQPPANAPPISRIQFDINAEVMAVNQKYFAALITTMVVLLIIAAWLAIGGVQVLRMRPAGRKLLLYAFLATIVFEVCRTALTLIVQLETIPIIEEGFNRALKDAEGRPEERMVRTMMNFMYGASLFGLVTAGVWAFVKVLVYGLCARYLAKPEIVTLFENWPTKPEPQSTGIQP